MKRQFIKKILLVALVALSIFGIANINVNATGYTYDHKGKVIYSTEGFTVNQTPYIYETLGIKATSFSDANPSALFVYALDANDTMPAPDDQIGNQIVYLLDSGGASKTAELYVFDASLKLQREIPYLRYNPATLQANSTNLNAIKSGKQLVVTSKTTVAPTEYTVKFVNAITGEIMDTQTVVSGQSAATIIPEVNEGYYFNGWDKAFDKVTEDMTVTASYETSPVDETDETNVLTVTVTYKNNVNSDKEELVILKGGSAYLPTPKEIDGYEFVKWDVEDLTKVSADKTVTAQYKKIHTVTFVDAENANAEIAKVKVLDGDTASAPFVPYHDGKVFKAWDRENGLKNITSDVTIAATYEDNADALTVTFIDSVSGNEIGKVNVVSGEAATAPAAIAYDAYTFVKWDKDFSNVTENMTVTAVYTQKSSGMSLDTLLTQTEMKLYMAGANCVYRGIAANTTPHTDYLYICDTSNNQILVIEANSYQEIPGETGKGTYEIVQIITSPTNEIGSTVFSPIEVCNDAAGRVYAICEGIEDGILEFSKNGTFDRYVGTNYVTLSAWEILTRNFATEAQLDQFTTYQNTTFTSMVYKNNMIYTTSYSIKNSNGTTNDTIMIKKINPSGKDVLRRNGYAVPKGDVTYTTYNDDQGAYGASQFVGITVNEYGVYTVVDNKRGRLFTYDNEGNLLYISGGSGTQLDKINIPIAVQYLGDNILVLDSKRKAIIVFEPTDIAKVINEAIKCEYAGKSEEAYEYWEQVIQLNANYEHAYVGIGKHYMEDTDIEDNFKKAMNYFELGANQIYYSKAFKQYRDGIIKAWFPYVVTGIIVIAVGGTIFKKVRRKKLGIKEEEMTGMGDE